MDDLQPLPRSINDGLTAHFSKVPLFLHLTEPSAVGTTEAIARDAEIDDDASGHIWNLHAPMATDAQWANYGSDDQLLLFAGGLGARATPFCSEPMVYCSDELGGQTQPPQLQILDDQMETLVTHLANIAQAISRQKMSLGSSFNLQLARSTFTARNLQYFAWVYFQRVQP